MSCLITRPDPQTLFDHYRNMFSTNVLGGAPVVPESNEWYAVALNYAMAEEFHAISEQQWKERDPRYACCDNLVEMAARDGVFPKPAQYATGYMRLTGVPGSALPSVIEVQAGGNNFVTAGNVPSQISATGNVVLRIRALTTGPTANAVSGSIPTGTLLTPIVGVDSEVEICGGRFCGGANAEECEAFRTRYIARKQYKPRSNDAWLREKIMEWPCVTRVCERTGSCCVCNEPCDASDCGGNLNFYALFDGTFPCGIAPFEIIAEINTWLFGENPGYGQGQVDIGICGRIFGAFALPVNVSIDIAECPTPAQQAKIVEQVSDLFTTICPSQILLAQQINIIVANVMGSTTNSVTQITQADGTSSHSETNPCGDLEPDCDYLPCLNEIIFTGPGTTGIGGCA